MNIRKNIYNNYTKKSFKDQLYYGSIDELIKNYGGFVLTKFLSGGQATALYSGVYIENTTDTDIQKESNLNTEISATIDISKPTTKTKSTSNSSQNVYLGKDPSMGISTTKKFQSIQFSLRTQGGLPAYSQFSVPKDVNSITFDLSAWSRSLENTTNLTIAELIDESLIPISEFIEENNLKELIYSYYKNGSNEKIKYLKEPSLVMQIIPYTEKGARLETFLITRYNDRIALRTYYMEPSELKLYVNQETARIKLLFPDLKITSQPNFPYLDGYITDILSPSRNEFDMKNMSKFIDSATGKIYLLTTVPQTGEKLAYTLYDDNVVNDYAFEDIINNLPVNNNVTLSMIIKQYRLIAL